MDSSEHGDAKLVLSDSTETIVAETFLETRFCKELSFLVMLLTLLKIDFGPEKNI